VAGGNSVLPAWVRYQFPQTVELLKRLRDTPCDDPSCVYCRRAHDPVGQLNRYFSFSEFRPQPQAEDGSSLQEAIVRRGMGDQPLLAILPTGGGKSLCFQLPAAVRNHRRGVLTVVLSPLQALMKDQVDNLVAKTGCPAAALSGLLTPLERGQVLERVRLGDVAILYISPEQLRNNSTIKAIKQREIGCWVFDEAHCLSKWGHDFRPDYLYAARFIRELADDQRTPIPPIACFTATAKRDVVAEILSHFRTELGQELEVFRGGVERDNLRFEVQPTATLEKFARVHELLSERLDETGCAVVYAATRKGAEQLAEHLSRQGWDAAAFHAGLSAPEKRRIQDEFIGGDVRVICATNAFGMGIDKDDVRMVLHADMPGSLENYLQEAGRAGRDRQPAECVLLYGDDDVETQFALSAISRLTPRDIAQILRGLRRAKRKSEVLVITSGELLRNEDVDTSFDSDDNMADTKVKTAIAWLERAGFVQRNHNATFVFQGKPRVRSLPEAEARLRRLGLAEDQRRLWLEILQELINVEGPEGLNADHLAELPAFRELVAREQAGERANVSDTERVLRTLDEMHQAGLLERGAQLSAFVRYKVEDSSQKRLRVAARLESALLQLLQEAEPEAGERQWINASLRMLNQELVNRGEKDASQEAIRLLLDSLSRDGRSFGGNSGSLEFRHSYQDQYRVKLRRDWPTLIEISEKRRAVADVILRTILERVPAGSSAAADRLVEFSLEDLMQAVQSDLALRGQIRDTLAAIERGLMYLHEQKVIILQHGLSVFRQAMTIRLPPEAKGRRYAKGDFTPLAQHYQEQVLQVHVMYEYARRGVESIQDGLKLVLAYFSLPRLDFIERFFGDRKEVVGRAISHEAYQRIVDQLRNPVQQAVVAAPDDENALVLAGPGSGKTRAVVHRVAYLVRVRRFAPQSILVLCFNRLAAIQLKRRLRELIGSAAARVAVLTYHGLAARLTGTSFAASAATGGEQPIELSELIPAATRMLRGDQPVAGLDADEVRDRLLAGYRFVLVDEYQDIDEEQYELISALTDRTGRDPEAKLTILAVGDDDQNIYAFRGTNVAFIKRFQQDYRARCHYLLDNYRSTANIIAAANRFIAHNADRMKTKHPIRIDAARRKQPPGGRWHSLDAVAQGRVQVLELRDEQDEAAAVVAELRRLARLREEFDWSSCAVLARTRDALHPIRSACEHVGIPVLWGLDGERTPRLHRIREVAEFLDCLHQRRREIRKASELAAVLQPPRARVAGAERGGAPGEAARTPPSVGSTGQIETTESSPGKGWEEGGVAPFTTAADNPWQTLLQELLDDWREETSDAELPIDHLIQYLYESLAQQRREQRVGRGVFLSTVHSAKGTEFDHVLVPNTGWTIPRESEKQEEERRLYYVAMTRARHTLCLFSHSRSPNPHARLLRGDFLVYRQATPAGGIPDEILQRRYELLWLDDIQLGFAGSRSERHPIHSALADLRPGSPLRLKLSEERLDLIDSRGRPLARLSQTAFRRWRDRLERIEEIRVLAVLRRERADEQSEFRSRCRCERWEVPLVELVYRP
jgi:ATP-dependent DNA helicase RecQ